jgi:phage shock protein PspC (stress-responsive transcriptional regulator)
MERNDPNSEHDPTLRPGDPLGGQPPTGPEHPTAGEEPTGLEHPTAGEEPTGPEHPAAGEPPTTEAPPAPGAAGGAGPGSAPPPPTGPPPPTAEAPRRLVRSRDNRLIGGVAAGVADYLRIDPVIVRVLAVALVFAGGAGLLLYLAGLLLMPNEDGTMTGPQTPAGSGRAATIAGAVVLAIALVAAIQGGFFWGAILLPLGFLALAGLGIWWLSSGEGPAGTPREVLRRIGLGLAVLALCCALAFAGFWAGATGGGAVVAGVVIAAGVALLVGAFVGGARWLILPALALALPLAVVSAAGVDTDGGVGEREYRPTSAADVRDRYELGMGSLIVDLRDADLPPGDHRLNVEVGVGEAVVVVPPDVCVASTARVGVGAVELFDRDSGGIDVDWDDRPSAPAGTTRLVVNADVGIGRLQVAHRRYRDRWNDGPGGFDGGAIDLRDRNTACAA